MDANAAKVRLGEILAELEALSQAATDNRKPVALDQQSVGRLSRMDKAAEQLRHKKRLRIGAALARIEAGDYGYCVTCDEETGARPLELYPSVPLCIGCAGG